MRNTQKIARPVSLEVWEKRMQEHVTELSRELKAALKERRSAKIETR